MRIQSWQAPAKFVLAMCVVTAFGGLVWITTNHKHSKRAKKEKLYIPKKFQTRVENLRIILYYCSSVASLFVCILKTLKAARAYQNIRTFIYEEVEPRAEHRVITASIRIGHDNHSASVTTLEFPQKAQDAVRLYLKQTQKIQTDDQLLELPSDAGSIYEIWNQKVILKTSEGSSVLLPMAVVQEKLSSELERTPICNRVPLIVDTAELVRRERQQSGGWSQNMLGLLAAVGLKSTYHCTLGERTIHFGGEHHIFGVFKAGTAGQVVQKVKCWAKSRKEIDLYFFSKFFRSAAVAVAAAATFGAFVTLFSRRIKKYQKRQIVLDLMESQLLAGSAMRTRGEAMPMKKVSLVSDYYMTIGDQTEEAALVESLKCECKDYYKNVSLQPCQHVACCFHCYIQKNYKKCPRCKEKVVSHVVIRLVS